MILTFNGDMDKARSMVRWLHGRLDKASKESFNPNHSSYLNDTVSWKSRKEVWMLTCKPKRSRIELTIPDDTQLSLHIRLTWS